MTKDKYISGLIDLKSTYYILDNQSYHIELIDIFPWEIEK